jgi:uncharacterized protein involved in exopolysaccharide biosynthesis
MGAVTGYVLLSGMSPDYRSQATIQVMPPRILGTIVPPANQTRLQDRLQTTQQAILTRTKLERMIHDLNLYERERRSGAIMQDVVEQLRSQITVALGKGDSFTVSFQGRDRRQVQKVAEQLAGFFITESLKDGERRAESTSDFVEAMVADAGTKLAEHDERMAAARAGGGKDSGRMLIEAEVLRSSYKSWLEKREQAAMRVNLERSQNGEQFVLLEPARLPERPEGPTRRAASVAGALAGLVLGLIVNLFLWIRRALAARAPRESAVNGGI